MHIIPLTTEHAEAYRRLMLHGYRHAEDAFTSTYEERVPMPLSWWHQRLGDEHGECRAFGALVDDEMVGAVALGFSERRKTRHKAYLIGLYVREAGRGKGAGRGLVAAVLDAARQRGGIRVVTLTVTEGNTPAIALYQAMGFETFGVEPMAMRSGDGFIAKLHMWRDLGRDTGGAPGA